MEKKHSKIFAGIVSASIIALTWGYTSCTKHEVSNEIEINPQNISVASGKPDKKTIKHNINI